VRMSETQKNSAKDSLRVFQIATGLCAKTPTRARFPIRGPTRAGLRPLLFIPFLFLFIFLPDVGNL
jgi:hypothetical protein